MNSLYELELWMTDFLTSLDRNNLSRESVFEHLSHIENRTLEENCQRLVLCAYLHQLAPEKYKSATFEQISWFIANHPDHVILFTPFAHDGFSATDADLLAHLWDKTLAHTNSSNTIINGACFFEQRNLGKCLELVLQATRIQGQSELLDEYVMAILRRLKHNPEEHKEKLSEIRTSFESNNRL